ncbi:MAG: PepSY domain-containing protein [Hyphomicrobiales bacterium]
MKRLAYLASLSLCIAVFGGGSSSSSFLGGGSAWADGDDHRQSEHRSGRDVDKDGTASNGNFSGGFAGEQNKLGALHDAVTARKILPLSELKAIIVERFGANIIDVEIEREDGQWIYEFKIISQSGRLLEVYVNAETGRIIGVEND